MQRAVFVLLVFATFAFVTACSGSGRQNAPLPVIPSTAPGAGGSPSVDGFPISIEEFALPGSQSSPRKPVVGPDGAVWLPAGSLQMDRVTGPGTITAFTAQPTPPGNPDGTWSGFFDGLSYAGSIFTEFSGEGGVWGHPYSLLLARVTMDGAITPSLIVAPDFLFRGMTTDSSGGMWVLTSNSNAISFLQRFALNGTTWSSGSRCVVGGDDALTDSLALAYGPDHDLYAAGFSLSVVPVIYKTAPDCRTLGVFQLPTFAEHWQPVMTFGSDGDLWILNRGTAAVFRMTTSGTFTQYTVPFPGSALAGITKGSDGAIWFTDFGTNAIGRMTTAGTFAEFPVPTPNAFTQYGGGIVSCPQKCDGAHGRLWFSEDAASKIGRLEF